MYLREEYFFEINLKILKTGAGLIDEQRNPSPVLILEISIFQNWGGIFVLLKTGYERKVIHSYVLYMSFMDDTMFADSSCAKSPAT